MRGRSPGSSCSLPCLGGRVCVPGTPSPAVHALLLVFRRCPHLCWEPALAQDSSYCPVIIGASGAARGLALTSWPPGLQLACVSTCSLLGSTTLSNCVFWPFLWPCCGLLFPSSLSDVRLSNFVFHPLCPFYIFSWGFMCFVLLKSSRIYWGCAVGPALLASCRCPESEQNRNRCPPGAPVLSRPFPA